MPSNLRETREAVRQPDGTWPAEATLLGPGDTRASLHFGFACPLAELYD